MKDSKHKALKEKTTLHGHSVPNYNYCEECSHPNRSKVNKGRVPFKDKMSTRKD